MKDLPETSRRVLQIIEDMLRDQNQKGLAEYGQSIDDAHGYDWTTEALSECVDAMQYMARRMLEMEEENERLREETKVAIKHMAESILNLDKENEKLKASQTN